MNNVKRFFAVALLVSALNVSKVSASLDAIRVDASEPVAQVIVSQLVNDASAASNSQAAPAEGKLAALRTFISTTSTNARGLVTRNPGRTAAIVLAVVAAVVAYKYFTANAEEVADESHSA